MCKGLQCIRELKKVTRAPRTAEKSSLRVQQEPGYEVLWGLLALGIVTSTLGCSLLGHLDFGGGVVTKHFKSHDRQECLVFKAWYLETQVAQNMGHYTQK